jgi:hypothetical protein
MFLGSFFIAMFDEVCRLLLLMLGMKWNNFMAILLMIQLMGENKFLVIALVKVQ